MWKIPLLAALLCIFFQVSDSKMSVCTRQDSPSSISYIVCYTGCCGSNYTTHCCNTTTMANVTMATEIMPTTVQPRWIVVCALVGSVIVATIIVTIVLYFVCCAPLSVCRGHASHKSDPTKADEGYDGVVKSDYDNDQANPFHSELQDQQSKY
ncbi:uncharacterized protein LOC124138747 isoform X1 [Haliotis rufescens]|uniref:uncharacterized protein LOC124138747 isoform X1 n=1 Tax=Haliotis rufescens TaxID=6454 RepID=UPI00201F5197|nr:uncharacterized protein LOC124138747 isoform X1 [Haliotis rufescens]